MRSAMFPRIRAALTAAYGTYTPARPVALARMVGIVSGDSQAARHARTIGWTLGAPDPVAGQPR